MIELVARDINGKIRPRSGGIPGMKADCISNDLLIEGKTTRGSSINLKTEWIRTLEKYAKDERRIPVLTLQFENRSTEGKSTYYALIDFDMFYHVINTLPIATATPLYPQKQVKISSDLLDDLTIIHSGKTYIIIDRDTFLLWLRRYHNEQYNQ